MGRSKDPCWDEFRDPVAKEGLIVLQSSCKHCAHSIPANTTKLKFHLAICAKFKAKMLQKMNSSKRNIEECVFELEAKKSKTAWYDSMNLNE